MQTLKFNGETLTPEAIEAAKQSFIKSYKACIELCREYGEPLTMQDQFHVNDRQSYIEWQCEQTTRMESGEAFCTFAFLQRAYFEQTGKSIAFLPN